MLLFRSLGEKDRKSQDRNSKLAYKEAPQVTLYTKIRDDEEDAADAYKEPTRVDEECKSCLAISIDRAEQRGICIQKWTDPGQRDNKSAGSIAVKQECSDEPAENQKEETA